MSHPNIFLRSKRRKTNFYFSNRNVEEVSKAKSVISTEIIQIKHPKDRKIKESRTPKSDRQSRRIIYDLPAMG